MILKCIVFFSALLIFVNAFGTKVVFAQNGNRNEISSVSLEAEVQNLERAVARQGIAAAERHDALVRLARLRQLSGDIEGAARTWLEAASAIPDRVDDEALLNCAYCLAAMGEWDRAITALEPLLSRYPRARFLNTGIQAVRTGDTSALAAIVDNPEYSEMKSEIFYILWKLSRGPAAERWRQRLISEFPNSPEARLAAGGVSSIMVRPSPFWLFLGGLDSLPLLASEPRGREVPAPVVPQQTVTARLQTGIFSREGNAQAQVTSLRNAGFSPTIERRTVNNAPMWAVTVPVGADQSRTIGQLRAAGFEAFLVR
jgi:tetratricopeptide (TPR) repeat protein